MRQIYYYAKLIVLIELIFLSFLLTTACRQTVLQRPDDIAVSNLSECRTIQHKLGKSCVPANPKRVVVLDSVYLLDSVLALGIKPVGMATHNSEGIVHLGGLSIEEVSGIESVGDVHQTSLEKVLKLKPDLVIASDYAHESVFEQLSNIAPTVIIEYQELYRVKDKLTFLGQILNREEEANRVISQYKDRISTLKEQLGDRLPEIEVSYIGWSEDGFHPALAVHISEEIFKDIGLSHNSIPSFRGKFSFEQIFKFDADIMFVFYRGNREPSFYNLQNPLFSSLEAVKKNCAFVVDGNIWNSGGPVGLNRILDDLFRYLPKIDQNGKCLT